MSVQEPMSEPSPMSQTPEVGSDTKRVINPRVEIDTSPPFGSVQEAVTHFGGSGSWIPLHLLRLAAPHNSAEDLEMEKIKEQTAELERYLIAREMETHTVLNQLEETKRFVEDVKLKFESLNHRPSSSSHGFILMELNQAKLNLNKTTDDLAILRASVESLTQNVIRKEKKNVILKQQLSFEKEQFKNIAEGARYEVMKAMAEIEQTKTSITVVEMRLIAARKMEEAAKAVEAIACAEMRIRSQPLGFSRKADDRVTLSMEEYSSLTQKAQEAEEQEGNRRRRDEPPSIKGRKSEGMFSRPTISIGDVLNQKKVTVQDDIVVEKHIQGQGQGQVSLSQMLREQTGLKLQNQSKSVKGETSSSSSNNGHGSHSHKHFFAQQRKKFGFVDIALPLPRQNKKKMQQ